MRNRQMIGVMIEIPLGDFFVQPRDLLGLVIFVMRGAVIFPPIVIMVFPDVQDDAIDVLEIEVVIELLAIGPNVFMEFFGVSSFHVMIPASIDDGDLAFGDFVGGQRSEVRIIDRLDVGDDVARQNEEIVILDERSGLRCP